MAETILCISLTLSHNHGKLSCLSQQISLRQAGRLCKHEFQTLSDKKNHTEKLPAGHTADANLQIRRKLPDIQFLPTSMPRSITANERAWPEYDGKWAGITASMLFFASRKMVAKNKKRIYEIS